MGYFFGHRLGEGTSTKSPNSSADNDKDPRTKELALKLKDATITEEEKTEILQILESSNKDK